MGIACCKEEPIDFDAEVELNHFELLRSVGKGAFGKVRVVQHKKDSKIYALKYINKAKCIKMKAVENIIQERRLLEEINYPLICNLRFAFQDDENLFMVLDLMLGGDLRFHLDRQGCLKEEAVRFYVAEVALSLNYLHDRKIVHRDLKPDNVLLDEKGHAHITDFNIAVHYNEKKPLTAVAGSMAYMAPEVLAKKGYFQSVDWWSLGVMAYELVFGKRPFRGKTNESLTQAILSEDPTFPENADSHVSKECISCLKGFLTRDIPSRLGCGPKGFQDLKDHPWMKGLEWDKLGNKEATAPFIPDSKRPNFDATHELEELLLEENPLKHKKKTQPKPGQPQPVLSKEAKLMLDKFIVFDYTKPKEMRQVISHSYVDLQPIKDAESSNSKGSGNDHAHDNGGSPPASPKSGDGTTENTKDTHDLPKKKQTDVVDVKPQGGGHGAKEGTKEGQVV
ncbi:kinase-like domain-containing protein [Paraphysoderma sedebokerense]|nr:kinase-like domain-containing protein [Paraphysoderma sedebokerense]